MIINHILHSSFECVFQRTKFFNYPTSAWANGPLPTSQLQADLNHRATMIQDSLKIGQKYSTVLRARERVSELSERTSERMSELPIANVSNSRASESLCVDCLSFFSFWRQSCAFTCARCTPSISPIKTQLLKGRRRRKMSPSSQVCCMKSHMVLQS